MPVDLVCCHHKGTGGSLSPAHGLCKVAQGWSLRCAGVMCVE